MTPETLTADIYGERTARFLELAEAAHEASGRAASRPLQETYARLAEQWLHLAELARSTADLACRVSARIPDNGHDAPNSRIN